MTMSLSYKHRPSFLSWQIHTFPPIMSLRLLYQKLLPEGTETHLYECTNDDSLKYYFPNQTCFSQVNKGMKL